jgi:propane 2-monooxygenase large subunit
MSASLTLNKITAQKGISVGEAANRVADLGWTPSYVQEAMTFPTDYKISRVPRDPMKQVLRSYFPMQEEKDNRVYGALDAALRGDMFRNVEPRWIEWMKLFLAIIPFPEISAARSMAMVGRLSPGEELRTGFTMQMVDEMRHSTIQMNLKKWYMENYIDPAGFDITEAAFGKCYASTIGRQFAEGFLTGDAITAASIYLTVVAETAFTNTLFVAMPSEAARNGDYALPTVFLSVQSDESRHIGNGHSMLMAMLHDPSNHQLLERDLKYAFWQNHAIVDAAIGTFIEYGTTNRDKNKESARKIRHQDSPRRRVGGLGSHRQEKLRPFDRAILLGRLVGQFLAHRGSDREGLRVVRAQVSWLARRIRRLLEVVLQTVQARRTADPLQRRRGLRLSAPLLELHGSMPDPRGLLLRRSRRQAVYLLFGRMPLDP